MIFVKKLHFPMEKYIKFKNLNNLIFTLKSLHRHKITSGNIFNKYPLLKTVA